MNSALHIAPQLPPAIDGVGDYCWNLWRHWHSAELSIPLDCETHFALNEEQDENRQPAWKFLVARGASETAAFWPVEVNQFELNASSLAEALERSGCESVVLHYVGYGFQPKGIPLWLPRALCQWRYSRFAIHDPRFAHRRLITMFHEMYARSSPLRSPFWVAPLARRIIRDLVRLSDAWVTSCDRYFTQLTTDFGADAASGCIIPIGSNISPVSTVRAEQGTARAGRLNVVLFGLARTRIWALERHWRLLRTLNAAGAINSITLLGKRNTPDDERLWQKFADDIGPVTWRRRFDLSAEEISHELAAHDIGLLANEPGILTKSGVFAALVSHGVVPIVSTPNRELLPLLASAAALANDDAELISEIIHALGDAGRMQALRQSALRLAERELAWTRIARRWNEVLRRVGERAAGLQPAEANRQLQTGGTLEVPA